MSNMAEVTLGIASTSGATILAILPTDPQTIEALAKWPVVLILAAVAIYSIYSSNKNNERYVRSQEKQMEIHARSSEKLSTAISALVANLNQRPCIREPGND